jgi:hypothetical protein
LQFSCHAKSDWKITGFQAFPRFAAAHYALLQSGVAEGPPRLGAWSEQRRTTAAVKPVARTEALTRSGLVQIARIVLLFRPFHCSVISIC